MAEKETEVRTFNIEYECDKCQSGNMKPTGQCFTTDPPQFPHVCENCGERQIFTGVSYPYQVVRPKN